MLVIMPIAWISLIYSITAAIGCKISMTRAAVVDYLIQVDPYASFRTPKLSILASQDPAIFPGSLYPAVYCDLTFCSSNPNWFEGVF